MQGIRVSRNDRHPIGRVPASFAQNNLVDGSSIEEVGASSSDEEGSFVSEIELFWYDVGLFTSKWRVLPLLVDGSSIEESGSSMLVLWHH